MVLMFLNVADDEAKPQEEVCTGKQHAEADCQTLVADGRRRRRWRSWEPLELSNKKYEALLKERKKEPVEDFIKKNIVSQFTSLCSAAH